MKNIKLKKINQEEALRYLGYRNTKLDDNILSLIEESEREVRESANPRYIFKLFDIEKVQEGVYLKNSNLILEGNSIKEHLKNCHKAIAFAATIGDKIDKKIRIYSHGNMAKSIVVDAFASAAIEQVCELVEEEIRQEFSQYHMTFRFGIGYGDLPLSQQKDFLKILDASRKIGISLSSNNMMLPTKSVTAIIGLSKEEIEKKSRNCADCNLNKNCNILKLGNHCY